MFYSDIPPLYDPKKSVKKTIQKERLFWAWNLILKCCVSNVSVALFCFLPLFWKPLCSTLLKGEKALLELCDLGVLSYQQRTEGTFGTC